MNRERRRFRLGQSCRLLSLVALFAGCADGTEVRLVFEADPSLEAQAPRLCVRVSTLARPDAPAEEVYARCREAGDFAFPATIPVVRTNDAAGFTFEATLDLPGGERLGLLGGEVAFAVGAQREVRFRFTATCTNVACEGRDVCVDGRCEVGCFAPEGDGHLPSTPDPRACVTPPDGVDGGGDASAGDAGVDTNNRDAAIPDGALPDAASCQCECSTDRCVDGVCVPAQTVTRLSVGDFHACANTDDGLYCWGKGSEGELGRGTGPVDAGAPTQHLPRVVVMVPGGTALPDARLGLETGRDFSCAITSTQDIWCWGKSLAHNGEPHGHYADAGAAYGDVVPYPVRVTNDLRYTSLASGREHTCAIESREMRPRCAGQNDFGQIGLTQLRDAGGVGSRGSWSDWVQGTSGKRFNRISAGENHTCAIASAVLYCWGRLPERELASGSYTGTDAARSVTLNVEVGDPPVTVQVDWYEVGAGAHHTCAIGRLPSGDELERAIYCWGEGNNYRLGDGADMDRDAPTPIHESVRFGDWTNIALGDTHTCAIRGGDLFCWGDNSFGQLGNDTTNQAQQPRRIGSNADGRHWTDLSLGGTSTCGVVSPGKLYCWGSNSSGQLGIVTEDGEPSNSPQRVCLTGEPLEPEPE